MNNITLKEVSIEDLNNMEIYELLQNIDSNENGFINSGFGISRENYNDYIKDLIEKKTYYNKEKGHVPQIIFWMFNNKEAIGFSKLRLELTEKLRKDGGNIGYGISKNKRNKGFGKILLKLTLLEAKKHKIHKVLLTCNSKNISTKKVIESNNGILEKEENDKCWYWIDII